MAAKLDYDYFAQLRSQNPAWRLLCAESAPLMLSFFNRVFIEANARVISEAELTEKLEDELFFLHETYGEDTLTRGAQEYLKEWSEPEKGWLRRFYAPNADGPYFDLTPSAEKAVAWAISLRRNTFVGTESRLMIIFDLLRQIVESGEQNAEVLLAEATKKRDALTAEMEKIRNGNIARLDDTAVRERFQQFSSMARELLSDFREVEYNFRALDRDVRRKIALANLGKGEILDEVLTQSDSIEESDQGKSFKAFSDFLLSASRQSELHEFLDRVFTMPVIQEMSYDRRLTRISDSWLDASDHTLMTMRQLTAQLRQFLDGHVWLENRRITEILQLISRKAVSLGEMPSGNFMELSVPGVEINLPFERPMFVPTSRIVIDSHNILLADEADDTDLLFEQFYVDKAALMENIRVAMIGAKEVTLGHVLEKFPLTKGLAEVVAYMNIASKSKSAFFDDSAEETVTWPCADGARKRCILPRVIFTRSTLLGG